MKYISLIFFNNINFTALSSDELASYAYALICCQGPASVVSGEWYKMVADVSNRKISDLRYEINRRFENGDNSESLTHAMAVIEGTAELKSGTASWSEFISLSDLSVKELIRHHSISKCWYDLRRRKKMEVFTRSYQWRIVNELLKRKDGRILAEILLLAECIEADGYARILNLKYNIGEKPVTFNRAAYPSDEILTEHIRSLSEKADYISREELIEIADYIQTEIVEKGLTIEHLEFVNAILNTGMPHFDYPKISKEFEKATNTLAKTNSKSRMELAPAYYTLWSKTLKQSYLSRFKKTVLHCYNTLANGKIYPDLGVDINDSRSLSSAIRFLDANRQTLWILSDRYDVDSIIRKYQPRMQ